MGESNEDRLARKRRERQEYLKRQAEIDKYMAERLDQDPEFSKEHDAAFDREFEELFGQKPYNYGVELDREYLKGQGVSDADIDEAQKIMRKARKQAGGSWMTSKDPKKAAKMLKGSPAVKKVGKAMKKGKGCTVVALVLLGSSATASIATVWAAAEVLSRVFS